MQLEELPTSAKTITKSPLGIIALFIFLIYSIASLVLGVSAQALAEGQKWVFVVFLVVFPLLVLGSFVWLVANHAVKLYSPADFRDDKSYVELNQKLQVVQVKQEAAQVDPRALIVNSAKGTDVGCGERSEPHQTRRAEAMRFVPHRILRRGKFGRGRRYDQGPELSHRL